VSALEELEAALGAPPPPGLAEGVPEAELAALAALVRAARARESAALAEATEGALDHVPRVLRGPIRRIVLG
jgi:type IV secretory pathway VirB2 component (pilin)